MSSTGEIEQILFAPFRCDDVFGLMNLFLPCRAAVVHYNGNLKPWLEIGMTKYKGYWTKYVRYDHPFLQQCNLSP